MLVARKRYVDVQLDVDAQRYVNGANEELLMQQPIDFSLVPVPRLVCTLTALTFQTGGASGTYRVRIGGTPGVADGVEVCALTTTNSNYPSIPDTSTGTVFNTPPGPRMVKVTANASTLLDRARIQGPRIDFLAP